MYVPVGLVGMEVFQLPSERLFVNSKPLVVHHKLGHLLHDT